MSKRDTDGRVRRARELTIGDLKVNVVSDSQAEECDFVVCMRVADMPVSMFDNDMFCPCALCGEEIRHRPHVPKRPPKICAQCAAAQARKSEIWGGKVN